MAGKTPASKSLLFAFSALAALQGCGSCVSEPASDQAPTSNVGTRPSKIPPIPGDKSIPLDRPRIILDGATDAF